MRQLSIKEQYGTIKTKLDAEPYLHNKLTYYHFDLMCRKNIPRTIIGKLFNVSSRTVEKWQVLRNDMLQ